MAALGQTQSGPSRRPLALCVALLAWLVLPSSGQVSSRQMQGQVGARRHPASPCPRVFTYEGEEAEPDRWYGNVMLYADKPLMGVRLDVQLDRPAKILGNWDGEVSTRDNIRYTIVNLQTRLRPGPPRTVRIFVSYGERDAVPRLRSIALNGRRICPEDAVQDSGTGSNRPTSRPPYVTSGGASAGYEEPRPSGGAVDPLSNEGGRDTTTRRPTDPDGNRQPVELDPLGAVRCGTVSTQATLLVTNGQRTTRGQWPWHAALYLAENINLSYKCGGSLISRSTVVTAAHCVTTSPNGRPVEADRLVVFLGKYHLNVWSEGGVQDKQVSSVYVHPMYNTTTYNSDIALLILSSPVDFSTFVRPVCLWGPANTDIQSLENTEGYVVGWGFDEKRKATEDLMMAKMPVVSQQNCFWSYPNFYSQFTSNRTYCAGFRNGTSVCNGDSGGGMVFPMTTRDGAHIWQLRGIVSLSVNDAGVCDTSHYIVFTDVAKFLDWIRKYIK